MKRLLLVVAFASFAAHGQSTGSDPFTGGSAEAGAAKAGTCAACHGPKGNSANPAWPKLAGQHAPYTYTQLQAFKNGVRENPIMVAQAQPLSDQDMKDLAAYFAAQPAQPGVASPEVVEQAQQLYRGGDAERGIMACAGCHGPRGIGNAAAGYPRISGQHATYVAQQLRDYRAGQRSGGLAPMMSAVAAPLTDAEIAALASYVNGLN